MRKNLASQGFTVIETLVVLSLIATIAALALPRMGSAVKQHDLEMVAQNLVSDIRLVQQLGINSGGLRQCSVYFVSEKGGQKYYYINDGGFEIKRVYLPKTVNWTNLPSTVRFTVTGAPAVVSGTNSSQTITLRNSDRRELDIRIAPITGRVRVTDDVANVGDE